VGVVSTSLGLTHAARVLGSRPPCFLHCSCSSALLNRRRPRLFFWTIIGLGEPGPNIVVTVTPTPFGLVSGAEIKAIAVQPLPTLDDPKPRTLQPTATEPAPRWGLQATFSKPGRRFRLTVTLADGSVHDVDIYATPPPDEPKISTAARHRSSSAS
jgi:hypothetical protein